MAIQRKKDTYVANVTRQEKQKKQRKNYKQSLKKIINHFNYPETEMRDIGDDGHPDEW